MDINELSQAGVAYEEGLARFMGRTAVYEKFLRKFLQDSSFAELEKALSKGDTANAFRAAHTIKGTAGNLSFHRLTNALCPLVKALRSGDLALAQALYPAFVQEYQKLCAVIAAQS